jgi:hypothetical protein
MTIVELKGFAGKYGVDQDALIFVKDSQGNWQNVQVIPDADKHQIYLIADTEYDEKYKK